MAGFYFAPDTKTFHIVARLQGSPEALANVLSRLKGRVDIIDCVAYETERGKAIWSAFVRPLTENETEARACLFRFSSYMSASA